MALLFGQTIEHRTLFGALDEKEFPIRQKSLAKMRPKENEDKVVGEWERAIVFLTQPELTTRGRPDTELAGTSVIRYRGTGNVDRLIALAMESISGTENR